MNADIFIESFNNENFDTRNTAIAFISSDSNSRNKKLKNYNGYCKNKINLKCCVAECVFKVCCYKSVAKSTENSFKVNENGLITGFCTGITNISQVSINIM